MRGQPLASLRPYALSLLRMVSGFTFGLHGLALLFGMFGGTNQGGAHAVPFTLLWFAGLLELLGGFLIIIGLFTRFVAFVLSGQMAFAYFMAHAPHGRFPIENQGELAVVYSFLFLYLAIAGPGILSLDRVLRRVL
jgi:putative oxidoreductase